MKIEKNVPMPETRGGKIYPFSDMQVGDSILFDYSDWRKAYTASTMHAKRSGKKFSGRKTSENKYRIWRVK